MKRSTRLPFTLFLTMVLLLAGTAGVGYAQGDCAMAAPRGIGATAGRSSAYFYLTREAVPAGETGSIMVRGGSQFAGRVDLPVAGAWRARVEGAFANWRVTRQIYDGGSGQTAIEEIGHVGARQVVALVGRQGGRSPVCAYVLAGGGFYALGYRGNRVRSPGAALTAGIEVPTGDRGAVQADVQLHVINTRARQPVSGEQALAASLTLGWAYKF